MHMTKPTSLVGDRAIDYPLEREEEEHLPEEGLDYGLESSKANAWPMDLAQAFGEPNRVGNAGSLCYDDVGDEDSNELGYHAQAADDTQGRWGDSNSNIYASLPE